MTYYRIDQLDSDGLILHSSSATCADDHEACALARRMLNFKGHASIWFGTRHVGTVSPTTAAGIERLSRPWVRGFFDEA